MDRTVEASSDKYRDLLRRYWGYDDFRGIQREIIESISSGRDTMGLMPTGGGKSIAFQVPALALEGLCLVITPLIALMKDQVVQLRRRGIKAAAVYTGMKREEVEAALNNCIFGACKFLYVSPERLGSELFRKKLSKMRICLITVDEAHCISQWGYDFRPAYLRIADIRSAWPGVPVLALTATATPEVCQDVMRHLSFREPNLIRMSFRRENLVYVVRKTDDVVGEMVHILSRVQGCAIVYMRNREGTLRLAQTLQQEGITATGYHGGLDRYEREKRQNMWMRGEARVMVATNAFGMGIDKPDVRVVVHADVPDSPEEYFQEAGRAGRDGNTAYAVLLVTQATTASLSRRVAENYPPPEVVRNVYERLCCFFTIAVNDGMGVSREFDMDQFCVNFHLFPTTVSSSLKLLQLSGYITFEEEYVRQSRVLFLVGRDQLYRLEGLGETGDEVLRTMLRLYGGVFADYVFLSESFIAHTAGIEEDEVHSTLLTLSRRHVISYIPGRSVPRVVFMRRRCDTDRLVIPQEVYGERMNRYRSRIDAMLGYVSGCSECRSSYLLSYLGEKESAPCRRCDVCQARDADGTPGWQLIEARQWVDARLASGDWVEMYDLEPDSPQLSASVTAYLEELTTDDRLEREGLMVRLRH